MELKKNLEVLKRFKSKRNQVYEVNINFGEEKTPAIMKIFHSANNKSFIKEYNYLCLLNQNNIKCPRILFKTRNSLFLEYIPGILVNNLSQNLDWGNWIEKLAFWMVNLHKIKNSKGSLLKNDVNLLNFIFSKNMIYGLDFEEMEYGDPRKDIGGICFFLLTNDPSLTYEKNIIVKRFLKAYERFSGNTLFEIDYFIQKSAENAYKRRAKYFRDYTMPTKLDNVQ